MESAMFKTIRRWMKRLLPADRFHSRGVPQPVGPEGLRIWAASPVDAAPQAPLLGYLVTAGKLAQPVAFVFTREDGRKADYGAARAIAADMTLAGAESPLVFDLRKFDWHAPGHLEFILNLVLLPADRRGRAVRESSAGELLGAMLDYQGLRVPLSKGGHRRQTRAVIPIFEAPIAQGDWCEVPADLQLHLEAIDPKEKSGQSASVTLSPGQSESHGASELTAA
jgi:hypothetical protein